MEYLYAAVSYLIGSVPMAIVVARALNLPDPRTAGSRNPGATNVLRYGGKLAAALTLLGDVLKGVIALLLVQWFTGEPRVLALCGFAVFIGHLYPVFFRFKGGKGVATALGVWLVLSPAVAGALLATWILVAAVFRFSSLAALAAACAAPVYAYWLAPRRSYLVLALAMMVFLVWRHRSNIRNLLTGKESRISFSRKPAEGR